MYAKIAAVNEPKSTIAEAYRTLRTNLLFSSIDESLKTILVTSAVSGEGKTTTACNLAVMMASGGKKTLLVDCDMRRPNIHNLFDLVNDIGLSDLLTANAVSEKVVKGTEEEKLDILCAGTVPSSPADLLASEKLGEIMRQLRESYDCIIFDTPPLIPVTDAQLMSRHADGCLLVVLAGEVHRSVVCKAKDLLEKVDAKVVGTVLNETDNSIGGYFYNSYKKYNYSYGQRKKKGHAAGSEFILHS